MQKRLQNHKKPLPGHTISATKKQKIANPKKWIQKVEKHEVFSFCWPRFGGRVHEQGRSVLFVAVFFEGERQDLLKTRYFFQIKGPPQVSLNLSWVMSSGWLRPWHLQCGWILWLVLPPSQRNLTDGTKEIWPTQSSCLWHKETLLNHSKKVEELDIALMSNSKLESSKVAKILPVVQVIVMNFRTTAESLCCWRPVLHHAAWTSWEISSGVSEVMSERTEATKHT